MDKDLDPKIKSEDIKKQLSEFAENLQENVKSFNEEYKPLEALRKNYKYVILIFVVIILILMFPLATIWIMATVASVYHGGKIIKSILDEKRDEKQHKQISDDTSAFIWAAISEHNVINLPVKVNGQIVERQVEIVQELEDGIRVRDQKTKINSDLIWDQIYFDKFYADHILPRIAGREEIKPESKTFMSSIKDAFKAFTS